MNTLDMDTPRPISQWSFPLLSAFLVSLVMFFLDEGEYNFRWMTSWGNWFVFSVYVLVLFAAQALILKFMSGTELGRTAARFISLAGIPIGLAILFAVFAQ